MIAHCPDLLNDWLSKRERNLLQILDRTGLKMNRVFHSLQSISLCNVKSRENQELVLSRNRKRHPDVEAILAPTRWKLRKAVRIVDETLAELQVVQHSGKTFIGPIRRGFDFFVTDGDEDRGLWHVTLWHTDARTLVGKPSDHGVALTIEQELGDRGNIVPFLRYSYADRGTNPIRQNVSVGVGIEDVLTQNEDLIGMAFSWGTPSDRSLRDEYVFEMFYRILMTPHTHVTPDLQVIIDPANAPDRDSVALLGLRLRTLY